MISFRQRAHANAVRVEKVQGKNGDTGKALTTIRVVFSNSQGEEMDLVFDSVADAALFSGGIATIVGTILNEGKSPLALLS